MKASEMAFKTLKEKCEKEGRDITVDDMAVIYQLERNEWKVKHSQEEQQRHDEEMKIRTENPERYDSIEKVIEEYIQHNDPYFENHLIDGGLDIDKDIRPLLYKAWDAACQYMADEYLQPDDSGEYID